MSKKEQQLLTEHSTLIEQYKAARSEIESLLDASRQVVNLSLTVISLFIGVAVFIEAKLPIAFLIIPLFFYALAWVQLRHILLMRRLSAYISEVIAPRVRNIIENIHPERTIETGHIMNWEENWQSPGNRKGGLFLLPVLGANFGLPLFTAILLLITYFFSVSEVHIEGWILIIVNLLAFIYSAIMGILVEFRRFGQDFQPTNESLM